MTYLIDAYNLMHAVGYLNKATPANRMESSRRRLLDWLAGYARSRRGDRFHVVFDATASTTPMPDEVYMGLTVSYAVGETADAVLIREFTNAKPGTVSVVSNDSEIREAARRKGVASFLCSAFVDQTIVENGPAPPRVTRPEKPEITVSEDELLKAFSEPKARRPRVR